MGVFLKVGWLLIIARILCWNFRTAFLPVLCYHLLPLGRWAFARRCPGKCPAASSRFSNTSTKGRFCVARCKLVMSPKTQLWKWCLYYYILVSDGVTGCEVFLLLQRPFGQFLNHWDCLSGDGTPKSCKGNSIDETRGFIALVICNKTRSFHRNTWLLPSTSLRER